MYATDEQAIKAFVDAGGDLPVSDGEHISPNVQYFAFGQLRTRGIALSESSSYIARVELECPATGMEYPGVRDYGWSNELATMAREYAEASA